MTNDRRVVVGIPCLLALVVAVTLLLAGSADAASFAVTKTDDTDDGVCDADCSLREAIAAATASAGPDEIMLPAGTYTITSTLTHTDTAALTITGADEATTIIDGATNGVGIALQNHAFALTPGPLTVSDLTITADGGGIRSWGDLSATNTSITVSAVGGFVTVLDGQDSVRVTTTNVTIDGTSPDGVLGIRGGTILAANTTITATSTDGSVGGIDGTDLVITDSTVTATTSGSFHQAHGLRTFTGDLHATNTVVRVEGTQLARGLKVVGPTGSITTIGGSITAQGAVGCCFPTSHAIDTDGGDVQTTNTVVTAEGPGSVRGIIAAGNLATSGASVTATTVSGTAISMQAGISGSVEVSGATVSAITTQGSATAIISGSTATITNTPITAKSNGQSLGVISDGAVTIGGSSVSATGDSRAMAVQCGSSDALIATDTPITATSLNGGAFGIAGCSTVEVSGGDIIAMGGTGSSAGINAGSDVAVTDADITATSSSDTWGIATQGAISTTRVIVAAQGAGSQFGTFGLHGNDDAIVTDTVVRVGQTVSTATAYGIFSGSVSVLRGDVSVTNTAGQAVGVQTVTAAATLTDTSIAVAGMGRYRNESTGVRSLAAAPVDLERTTVAATDSGGDVYGVFAEGPVNAENSTVSSRTAVDFATARAIQAAGPVDLVHVTAVASSPSPIALEADGQVANSILVGECAGSLVSLDGNVVTGIGCAPSFALPADQVVPDARLGPLGDNGGPLSTHLPLSMSAAIDNAVAGNCTPADERGAMRPSGLGCDSGAVEVQGPDAVDDTTSAQSGIPITVIILDNDLTGDYPLDRSTGSILAAGATPNGSAVYNADGTATYTSTPGFSGADRFDYVICDTVAMCAGATVTVAVTIGSPPPPPIDTTHAPPPIDTTPSPPPMDTTPPVTAAPTDVPGSVVVIGIPSGGALGIGAEAEPGPLGAAQAASTASAVTQATPPAEHATTRPLAATGTDLSPLTIAMASIAFGAAGNATAVRLRRRGDRQG